MTREHIRRMLDMPSGIIYTGFWKCYSYSYAGQIPLAFRSGYLNASALDEAFTDHWPLMRREGDQVIFPIFRAE